MKVLIDIRHVAHLNFFKNAILYFENNDINIIISVLNRGRLKKIVRNELPGRKIYISGKHRGTYFSIIVESNIFSFFSFLWILLKERPTICISAGGFVSGAAFKLFGKKNYQFDDDVERNINVFLEKNTATKLFFPPIHNFNRKNIFTFNALKEWAYLSPKYFKPQINSLKKYNLSKKKYIFIREVANNSLNYINQKEGVFSIAKYITSNEIVLFSLENKENVNNYPSNWILLQEPVTDLHSLIYYSKLLISSGDSMAREGAMLGVHSIYIGFREMKANDILIDKKLLSHVQLNKFESKYNELISKNFSIESQEKTRKLLLNEWDDVTDIICNCYKKL